MYHLKPGDVVTGIGPFGDFLIRENEREMVYVGGGAGMAPLRSHLAHLFETLQTKRRVTFWYGARSKQEIFYESYFRDLEARFPNFTYHIALSEPQVEDDWNGHSGFIHEVLKKELLDTHPAVDSIDYYLCGPPMMIQATQTMLTNEFFIPQDRISYDEF
jgi:Na+-transporting NADH:ubiquinone oxidoreductase subunit F